MGVGGDEWGVGGDEWGWEEMRGGWVGGDERGRR